MALSTSPNTSICNLIYNPIYRLKPEELRMPPELPEKTDYTRWRLLNEDGRHTWHYLEDDESSRKWPQTLADKYYLGLPLVCIT